MEFMKAIKTGDLKKVLYVHEEYMKKLKDVLSKEEIEYMFEPLLMTEEKDMNTPFCYAMRNNLVTICDWMYKNCENVKKNMMNCPLYNQLDEICELGHLEMLNWLAETVPGVIYADDMHIDCFILAVTNNYFDVADHLCQMYKTDNIIRDCTEAIVKNLKNKDLRNFTKKNIATNPNVNGLLYMLKLIMQNKDDNNIYQELIKIIENNYSNSKYPIYCVV
ncbi:MAG: hypothetical protein Satyrvirus24_15 [Satyrvirus sp.]|uniref:Ankyrin repeat protein n=1 Tax=Satyrvirus sp. TaxID=2487771 RepID=A0A3G5AH16_9VIRU|nr:MAG: hypothetical protein Satyrvirus24_15 [Satyrvirus sp.]